MTTFMEIMFTVNIDRAILPCYDSESTINWFDDFVISASVKINMFA